MRIVLTKGQILGPISGADETLVTYATQLHRAGHSVSVLLMYLQSFEDPYYKRLIEASVPVSYIASNLSQLSLGMGRRVVHRLFHAFPASERFIRGSSQRVVTNLAASYYAQCLERLQHQKPDLLHVLTPDPSAMVMIRAAHASGIPVIYQELGVPYHPPNFERYYKQFTSILPFCSEIAALSPLLAQACREKLPNSITPSVLPIMSAELNGHKVKPRSAASVTFGFAARIEKLKGPMVLMEAFAKAHRSLPTVQLKVAGEGSQRRNLSGRASSLGLSGSYHYYGIYNSPVERASFMQSLDVFVLPSFTEGTPNSIIEAMAHGLPIIASAVGGIPDMINPQSGILVPPGDLDALSQAIIRLARDPQLRQRMGVAARDRYLKLFSPQAVLPIVLETYQRVSGSNGTHTANSNGQRHPWTTKLEFA